MLNEIHRFMAHAEWADRLMLPALQAEHCPNEAVREYAHVLGAEETWLSRMEGRTATVSVWPTLTLAELSALCDAVHAGYAAYLSALDAPALEQLTRYTNSAGQSFETSVSDILMHVALHGQYHRGKVNLLLRQAGLRPAPTDFIAFVRGTPAARSAQAL